MRACIFGAGEYHGEGLALCEGALILAADGGLAYCDAYGLSPTLAIGDFDSLGRIPEGVEVIRHPVEKDDTDMALAVSEARLRGADEIFLLGALGGRLDHTLANITLLRARSRAGCASYILGERETLTVIGAGERLTFSGEPDGVFSLFALTDRAILSVSGAQYPLCSGTLYASPALGVSNHFQKTKAEITVESGEVLLVWESQNAPMPRREALGG